MASLPPRTPTPRTAAVAAGFAFSATALILVGLFQVVQGLSAIIDEDFFVPARGYAFDMDVTVWGWIHVVLGAVVLGAGIALVRGRAWARWLAVALAGLSALLGFLFVPYTPFGSALTIAVAVFVIWSLTRPEAAA
jgi:hypothetical protein